jgi:hypothetical protein
MAATENLAALVERALQEVGMSTELAALDEARVRWPPAS